MTEKRPLVHVSASQIKTYRRCKRKWFWEKIRGFRSPDTRATLLGKHVHSLLEHYLEHGKVPTHLFEQRFPEAWDIALPGLENLPPPPIPKRYIERAFLLTCFRVPAYGFIDLLEPDQNLVTDHKTTSDLKYAFGQGNPEKPWHKPAELLLSDPQALLYCAVAPHLFTRGPDAEYLDLPVTTVERANLGETAFRHVYYRTRGAPRSVQTEVRLTGEDLGSGLDKIDSTINAMVVDATRPQAADIQPNLSACKDYGGCPHLARCQAIGDVKLGGLAAMFSGQSEPTATKTREKKSMGFFDKPASKKPKPAKKAAETSDKPSNLRVLLQIFWKDGPQSSGNAYMEKEGLIEEEHGHFRLTTKGVDLGRSLGMEGVPSGYLGNKQEEVLLEPEIETDNPAESQDKTAVSDKHQDILRVLWANGSLDFCAQALVQAGLVGKSDDKYVLTKEGGIYCTETLGLTGSPSSTNPPDNGGQEGEPDGRSPDDTRTAEATTAVNVEGVQLNPPDGTAMDQKTEMPPEKAGRRAKMKCPVDVPDGEGGHVLRANDPIKSTTGKPDLTLVRKAILAGLTDEQNTLYYSLTNLAETKGNKPDLYADIVLLVQIVSGQTPDSAEAGDKRHDNQKPAPAPAPATGDTAPETASALYEPGGKASASPAPATSTATAAPQKLVSNAPVGASGPVLYLDAMPLHVLPTRLEVWLQPLLDAIANGEIAPGDTPVAHYRAMGFDTPLKRLCQGLAAWLRDGKLELPEHLVVDRRLYCAAAVEVLLPRYQAKGYSIVQGTK